jgi:hypothetical protein
MMKEKLTETKPRFAGRSRPSLSFVNLALPDKTLESFIILVIETDLPIPTIDFPKCRKIRHFALHPLLGVAKI